MVMTMRVEKGKVPALCPLDSVRGRLHVARS